MIWSRIYRVKIKFTDPPWNCRQKLKYIYAFIKKKLLYMANTTLYCIFRSGLPCPWLRATTSRSVIWASTTVKKSTDLTWSPSREEQQGDFLWLMTFVELWLISCDHFRSHTLSDLRPNTKYSIFMLPYHKRIKGTPSNMVTALTQEDGKDEKGLAVCYRKYNIIFFSYV